MGPELGRGPSARWICSKKGSFFFRTFLSESGVRQELTTASASFFGGLFAPLSLSFVPPFYCQIQLVRRNGSLFYFLVRHFSSEDGVSQPPLRRQGGNTSLHLTGF